MELHLITVLILMTTATGYQPPQRFDLKKGVIVHLFEWKWLDIAKECEEFLAPMGYAGVQISPPNENIIITNPMRPWWERYRPVSYKLNTRSGTEAELQEMLDRCNAKGVRIFADVVFNHMTGEDGSVGTAGSSADYANYHYPGVEYTELDFHRSQPPCDVKHYDNEFEVRFCQLEGMRDLDQSKTYVQEKILEFLNKLIHMGVAGFRVNAARHMWPSDLRRIFDRLDHLNIKYFRPHTRPLIYLEVIDYGTSGEAIRWSEYTEFGLITDFIYIGEMGDTFLGTRAIDWFRDFATSGKHLPSDVGVVFVDNHDTQRKAKANELTNVRFRPYKMAIAFMLAYPWGTPKILSGFKYKRSDDGPPHDEDYNILSPHPIEGDICKNDWSCEHRWRQIYNMVRFHNVVAGTEVTNFESDGYKQIAFCRGNKGFIAFNTNAVLRMEYEYQTCLPKGKYCDVISGNLKDNECTGKIIEVKDDGMALIEITPYEIDHPDIDRDNVVAIHVKSKILDEDDKKPKTEIEKWCVNNENQISFCDDKKGFIAFSKKEFTANAKLKTCLPKGMYCDVVSGNLLNNICTGRTVEVAMDGTGILNKGPVKDENYEEKNFKLVVIHVGARIIEENENEPKESEPKESEPKEGESEKPAGDTTAITQKKYDPLTKKKTDIVIGKRRSLLGLKGGGGFWKGKLSLSSSRPKSKIVHENPICEKLEELISNRDGLMTLSTFVAEDDDPEMLKVVSKKGKVDMIGDLVSLIK